MARKVLSDLDFGAVARVTGLPAPVSASEAVNKSYVDALKSGLDWKDSVRVASTANINLASPGASIDGVSLSAGERFLAKNQTTPSENGIYVWNGAAVAATRAPDADSSAEVTPGLSVPVEEGTANADTVWLLTTNGPITLGTTALSFTQLGSLVTASGGLTKTGNDITLDVPVTIARGGTGQTSANAARVALGASKAVSGDITGDGSAVSLSFAHNLGLAAKRDAVVSVVEATTDDEVDAGVHFTDVNTVRIDFASAPANGKVYRVTVVG